MTRWPKLQQKTPIPTPTVKALAGRELRLIGFAENGGEMGNQEKRSAQAPDKSLSPFERLFAIGAIAFLAAALGLSEYARFRQQQQHAVLEGDLSDAKSQADAALMAVIPPAVLADAERSVYMVLDDNGYYGSAFVIDRERGLLATAAHVAEVLAVDDPDSSVRVLNRFSERPLRVRARRIHSGYGELRRVAEAYQPIDPESRIIAPEPVAISDFANDAAILIVDPIDKETGENILGPSLPIAAEEDLLAITSGDPIAVIGYPFDVVNQATVEKSAASRVERGVVATTISAIDLAEESKDPAARNLIVHRMATAPGSSGGPVINRRGEVIGINTHGYDSAASNGDALAQRADLIHDMLAPLREEDVIERVYRTDWERRLSRWLKAKDAIPYSHYFRLAEQNKRGDRSATFKEVDFSASQPYDANVIDMKFGQVVSEYAVLAPDLIPDGENETDAEDGDDDVVAAEQTPVFVVGKRGQYAQARLKLPYARNHVIYAFDYVVSYNTMGYCPIALLHRIEGEDKLKISALTQSPAIFLPAEPDREGGRVIQIVVRRRPCGPTTNNFFVGAASWDRDAPDPAATPSGDTAALTAAFFDKYAMTAQRWAAHARCAMPGGLGGCQGVTMTLATAPPDTFSADGVDGVPPIVSIDHAGPDPR